mgnify:CR=1 FL=1
MASSANAAVTNAKLGAALAERFEVVRDRRRRREEDEHRELDLRRRAGRGSCRRTSVSKHRRIDGGVDESAAPPSSKRRPARAGARRRGTPRRMGTPRWRSLNVSCAHGSLGVLRVQTIDAPAATCVSTRISGVAVGPVGGVGVERGGDRGRRAGRDVALIGRAEHQARWPFTQTCVLSTLSMMAFSRKSKPPDPRPPSAPVRPQPRSPPALNSTNSRTVRVASMTGSPVPKMALR